MKVFFTCFRREEGNARRGQEILRNLGVYVAHLDPGESAQKEHVVLVTAKSDEALNGEVLLTTLDHAQAIHNQLKTQDQDLAVLLKDAGGVVLVSPRAVSELDLRAAIGRLPELFVPQLQQVRERVRPPYFVANQGMPRRGW